MAQYQGSYSTPNTNGSVTMVVEAQNSSHAEQLIKAQTGADKVYNIGYTKEYRDRHYTRNNNSNRSSGGSSVKLPGFGTILVGGALLMGLSIFGGKSDTNSQPSYVTETPDQSVTYTKEVSQPSVTYSAPQSYSYSAPVEYHQPSEMSDFLSQDYSDDTNNDLGQDWDN